MLKVADISKPAESFTFYKQPALMRCQKLAAGDEELVKFVISGGIDLDLTTFGTRESRRMLKCSLVGIMFSGRGLAQGKMNTGVDATRVGWPSGLGARTEMSVFIHLRPDIMVYVLMSRQM